MSDRADALDLHNPLWRFSLRTYAVPGVAPACLALQDAHGVDVNLLMFWLWAGAERGVEADGPAIGRADALIGAWRENVVLPLRAARSWMKRQPFMEEEGCARLREEIKRRELEAEQVEQAMLHRWAGTLEPARRPAQELARANLAAFLRHAGAGDVPEALAAALFSRDPGRSA